MRYLDFKKGQKYEVLANPAEIAQGYYVSDFRPGEVVIFTGSEDMIHESYTILNFEINDFIRSVKFSINKPEPDWTKYFREV